MDYCQRADEKNKEDEQTLEELNSAHRRSQATSYIKRIKLFLFSPYKKHLINRAELSRSAWENLDLGRVYRPHCVRSVLTTSVKILPYRPVARLIRAKYCYMCTNFNIRNTWLQCEIDYIHPSFLPVSLTWWLRELYH